MNLPPPTKARTRRRTLVLVILAATLLPALLWFGLHAAGLVPPPGRPAEGAFNLSDRIVSLEVLGDAADDGELQVRFDDGSVIGGEAFLSELQRRQAERGRQTWFFALLDITSWTGVFWVALGLFGQVLFTGRMLIQWLASEREKRSVVPASFWWLSLFGASMLIVYFIWRIDIVGVLGQSAGWLVYVRNLWFIHRPADDRATEISPKNDS